MVKASKTSYARYENDEDGSLQSNTLSAHLDYEWVESDSHGNLLKSSLDAMKRKGELSSDFWDDNLCMYVITDKDAMTYIAEDLEDGYGQGKLKPNTRYAVDADVDVIYHYYVPENGLVDYDDVEIESVGLSCVLLDEDGNMVNRRWGRR